MVYVTNMNHRQRQIISDLGVLPHIDHVHEINTRISFLKNYLFRSGMSGYVLGISGGQDSSLAGRLAQLAVEELRKETGEDYKFIAVRLPYGTQKDEEDAQRALKFIQPDKVVTFDIKPAVDAAVMTYLVSNGENLKDYHKGNVKARMRMMAQYAIGGQHNLLVIGTDHAAEAVTGFFTKFGDGGADLTPLSGLTKRQGKALLRELGADPAIWEKVPTADLLDGIPGQADEKELGITYEQIDDYLEGLTVPVQVAQNIERRFWNTRHKRSLPVTPVEVWWEV
jgi:NAD+ synthase